jgi:hypothetical protein
MIRHVIAAVIALCAAVLIAQPALVAHEGHNHRVMGTVKSIQAKQLEVQDKEGKTTTFTINDQTKILRGTTTAAPTDIKVGERIVVIATMEKETGAGAAAQTGPEHGAMTAKEIRLGAASKAGTH